MSDNKFIGGFFAKAPHPNAPDFVKGKVSIKIADFAQFVKEWKANHPNEEWISIDIKEGKSGKWYAAEDTWKPEAKAESGHAGGVPFDDDIPFAPRHWLS